MAGHSQFKNIMYRKGAQDAKKAKIFAKLARDITLAAKSGMPDPDKNPRLRLAIAAARAESMPKDNIERAIAKASQTAGGDDYVATRYEGFGPGNCMVIVDCLTDNVNRTYTSVKVGFAHSGFKLGVAGCVSHMFNNVALFTFKGHTDEEVLDALVMADCDVTDVEQDEEYTTVYAPQSEYSKIRAALVEAFGEMEFEEDETTWLASEEVELTDPEDIRKFRKFMDAMDDNDDVQNVYHNLEEE